MNRAIQILRNIAKQFKWNQFRQNPIKKIILINTAILVAWKIDLIPEKFMVKNFSFQRFNIRDYRIYTFLTYAFSHHGFISYAFNMICFYFFARGIQIQYGPKFIWMLYITGALFGSIAMNAFLPRTNIIWPQVGADAAVSAFITFYGLSNLRSTVYLFFFPIPIWGLLLMMSFYSLLFEKTKKNFAGMTAGVMVHQMMRMGFM